MAPTHLGECPNSQRTLPDQFLDFRRLPLRFGFQCFDFLFQFALLAFDHLGDHRFILFRKLIELEIRAGTKFTQGFDQFQDSGAQVFIQRPQFFEGVRPVERNRRPALFEAYAFEENGFVNGKVTSKTTPAAMSILCQVVRAK